MKSLFGRGLIDACAVAGRSDVFVDLAAMEVSYLRVRTGRLMGFRVSAKMEYRISEDDLTLCAMVQRHFERASS